MFRAILEALPDALTSEVLHVPLPSICQSLSSSVRTDPASPAPSSIQHSGGWGLFLFFVSVSSWAGADLAYFFVD